MSDTEQTGDMALEEARARGLVIDIIPTDAIDADYLVRDRFALDEDEMVSLMASIAARGQQIPVELTRHPHKDGQFGLISGWRRLEAIRRLYRDTKSGDYRVIRAMIVDRENAQDAYRAMIEENEIRVNLSHYERARIALRAIQEGVFPDERTALRALYGAATRSKRSKIGTFVALVDAFDGVLQHPTLISERLGLSLAREMVRDPAFAVSLSDRLRRLPSRTAPQELSIMTQAVTDAQRRLEATAQTPTSMPAPAPKVPLTAEQLGPIKMRFDPDRARVELSGDAVNTEFLQDLRDWLTARQTIS